MPTLRAAQYAALLTPYKAIALLIALFGLGKTMLDAASCSCVGWFGVSYT
jgi:hypothetical protein